VSGIPPGVDLISQAFASDVGVDNEALTFGNNGYVWFDVLGVTPARDRTLDEVKDQVETRWKDDQITSRLRTKATEMVQKLGQGGKLADEATGLGVKADTANTFKRDATVAGLPPAVIAAAFRAPKDGSGQAPGAGGNEWFVFHVSAVTVPELNLTAPEMKKMKDDLQRSLSDEDVGQYIAKLETDLGTTINQAAVAQVTGADSNSN
jgi:peptidyl-prolyl cis-trans isomerase D